MDRLERVWMKHSMAEVVEALLGWGHGSGEELYDFLTGSGIPDDQAQECIDRLSTALKSHEVNEETVLKIKEDNGDFVRTKFNK